MIGSITGPAGQAKETVINMAERERNERIKQDSLVHMQYLVKKVFIMYFIVQTW